MTEFAHIPVMLNECIDALDIKPDGIYIDGTLGGAGHSKHIAPKCKRLIGIDRDITAIDAAKARLEGFDVTFVNDNYNNINNIMEKLDVDKIDGVLLDLGVSSYQLDTPERGFSYRYDAPLDMRMNVNDSISAYDIVNTYGQKELEKILFEYGEEKFTRPIVRKIIEQRQQMPIKTTFELAELVKSCIPFKTRKDEKHPEKRVFQAIRIAVNDELSGLGQTVKDFCSYLKPGGRMAIITFHSLEDRIVKTAFNSLAQGCICPKEFPVCVCNNKPKAKVLTKKPILPTNEELLINSRSASAKLRVLEKLPE
ncbi:MAG: 16S rRNA (cytosine(1402)-N(4))-methyltransferase RsmH [Clostridia bacterium]|nr:16S rRNA (cytosine(1402)-N(4))-methyltransferase RsmH [Clostridia bacterium]